MYEKDVKNTCAQFQFAVQIRRCCLNFQQRKTNLYLGMTDLELLDFHLKLAVRVCCSVASWRLRRGLINLLVYKGHNFLFKEDLNKNLLKIHAMTQCAKFRQQKIVICLVINFFFRQSATDIHKQIKVNKPVISQVFLARFWKSKQTYAQLPCRIFWKIRNCQWNQPKLSSSGFRW